MTIELGSHSISLPTPKESEARLAEVGRQIFERLPTGSLSSWWGERVAKNPDNLVLKTDQRSLTYGELDALTYRIARATYRMGLRRGEVVALQLPSSAAFLVLILGLGKIGVRLSLLSPSLRGGSLRHALNEIPPRIMFTTPSSHTAIRSLECGERPKVVELQVEPTDLAAPSDSGLAQIEAWLGGLELDCATGSEAPEWEAAGHTQSPDETLFYIFTSGTTGLPKATQCSHRRYLAGGTSEAVLFGIDETDCMYVFLPTFHIAALSSMSARRRAV